MAVRKNIIVDDPQIPVKRTSALVCQHHLPRKRIDFFSKPFCLGAIGCAGNLAVRLNRPVEVDKIPQYFVVGVILPPCK